MTSSTPRLVLDTNVVLDCLVFRDPATRDLTHALQMRRVLALVHQLTLHELQRVLSYPQCRLDVPGQREIFDRYLSFATTPEMPDGFSRETLQLPPTFPCCRDPDDQPFLAIAYHARAEGLVTKDKALLKLRKKARRFDLAILAPGDLQLPVP